MIALEVGGVTICTMTVNGILVSNNSAYDQKAREHNAEWRSGVMGTMILWYLPYNYMCDRGPI